MEVKNIAVIGAGIMGHGIAQVAATSGFQVFLQDVSEEILAKALGNMRNSLARMVKKGTIKTDEVDAIMGRVQTTVDLAKAVSKADFAIEAVTEDLEIKSRAFEQLDRLAPKYAILASNTSQYSITSLAAATNRPDKVIGTHFFNPPVIMKLIEVARALDTSYETLEITLKIAKQMGKEVVVCKDSQGFITSRMINLWLTEAERILEEGIATKEDIDKACRLAFNHPMGPFELDDFSGLDTRLNVSIALEQVLGERFKPTQILRNLVRSGRLGRKSGRGFYNYLGER